MLISIPPKRAVSHVVGYIKGRSAIHLAKVYGERKRGFVGQHFWARGSVVSTVGRDEEGNRNYIRHQEKEDATALGDFFGIAMVFESARFRCRSGIWPRR